jgi:Flp pilus assembly protein TadG
VRRQSRSRERVRSERGQTLVEFAFASILFLTTIFGIVEFGLAVYHYNLVSDLAQEGARWASVRGSSPTAVMHATSDDVQSFVQGRALGIPVTVTTTWSPGNNPGDVVRVQVTNSYTPLAGLLPTSGMTLQSTAEMMMSR